MPVSRVQPKAGNRILVEATLPPSAEPTSAKEQEWFLKTFSEAQAAQSRKGQYRLIV